MKLEKHVIERIEGLTDTNAIINFKESVNIIIVDMLNEGWGYEDATDYMFDVIKATVEAHKRQDEEDKEFGNERASLARTHVIGKKVVIIDETQTQNNVSIKTISGFELEGMTRNWKKVVIIDETQTQNNVSIKTISDFELEGMIWFEEDEYGTHFAWESDIEAFLQGKKVYIHDGEVSMQLVNL